MQFVYTKQAFKTLKKLNEYTQKQIASYIEELEKLDNPRQRGEALTSNLSGLWRYRVGDYRLSKIRGRRNVNFMSFDRT